VNSEQKDDLLNVSPTSANVTVSFTDHGPIGLIRLARPDEVDPGDDHG
jgi:hypothetical protein